MRVSAGEMVESTAARPLGTTVEARNLFFNLPVRRGFLGTVRSDAESVATTAVANTSQRPPDNEYYVTSSFKRTCTTGQGSIQCLPVMMTTTVSPPCGTRPSPTRARSALTVYRPRG